MAMSLDRRLRDAFDRAASTVEPDVELHLERTVGRASRLNRMSAVGAVVAASAVTVALIAAIQVFGSPSSNAGGPTPAASPANGSVSGVYVVTLRATDPGVATSDLTLAGTWSMTLEPSGAIELVPPSSFDGSRAAGHTFSVVGSTLRTDLYYNDYCDSIGLYSWEETADGLTLTVVDDGCEIRKTVLATREWVRAE
jgi:hypothetical protein